MNSLKKSLCLYFRKYLKIDTHVTLVWISVVWFLISKRGFSFGSNLFIYFSFLFNPLLRLVVLNFKNFQFQSFSKRLLCSLMTSFWFMIFYFISDVLIVMYFWWLVFWSFYLPCILWIGFHHCLLLALYFLWMGSHCSFIYIYTWFFFHVGGYALRSDWKLAHLHLNSRNPSCKYIVMVKKLVMASCHIIIKTLDGRKCGIFYAYIESRKHHISIENISFQITLLLVVII